MVFLVVEDSPEQLAADVVGCRLAVGDRRAKIGHRPHLELQVAFQKLLHVLADQELVEILEVRQAFEEEDTLDQMIGDRKSTRLNSSHSCATRMPLSAYK